MEIQNTDELMNLLGLAKPVESLKVEKNSRGYNWEYKLVGKVEDNFGRMDAIEEVLTKKYGEKKEDGK